MSPEEQLDEARAEEAYRQWKEEGCQGDDTLDVAARAARLAREGWTPPEPVDPDLLAFREWLANDPEADAWTGGALLCRLGRHDATEEARAFLAGARMAREQERERANHPIAFAVRVMAGVFKDLDHAKREAGAALTKYRGES